MKQRKTDASGGRSPRRQVMVDVYLGGISEISHLVYKKSVQ